MKDMRGTEIKVGDVVAYPGRASSSLWLNIATVEALDEVKQEVQMATFQRRYSGELTGEVRRTRTRILRRLVVVQGC